MIQHELFGEFYSIPEGVETKKCIKCGVITPVEFFQNNTIPKNETPSGGKKNVCLNCVGKHNKIIRYLKKLHPLPDDGKCELCGIKPPSGKALCLDHHHEDEEFRGWLCNECNRGLGNFKDSLENITKAMHYLKQYEHKRTTKAT